MFVTCKLSVKIRSIRLIFQACNPVPAKMIPIRSGSGSVRIFDPVAHCKGIIEPKLDQLWRGCTAGTGGLLGSAIPSKGPSQVSQKIRVNSPPLKGGVQAFHFGKSDFELGVGGDGQDTSRHFEGIFRSMRAKL